MKAAYITEFGSPSVIKITDSYAIPETTPEKPFLVKVQYASVNFLDTYYRKGIYKANLPIVLGNDGAGIIQSVHESYTDSHFKVGDRVSIWTSGTYAEYATVNKDSIAKVPDSVPLDVATALTINGLTAHYLTRSVFPLSKEHTCLVQAVAGGTGQLIAQIAKKIAGAKVIGTCSTEKVGYVESKLSDVVDHIIDYVKTPEFDKESRKFTNGVGVDVVYDGVGQSTFNRSLDSLRKRGYMVSFGNASGVVQPFNPLDLSSKGSLYLTRPKLGDFVDQPGEFAQRAEELYDWYSKGVLTVNIQKHYKLEDVAQSHEDLEGRKSFGKFIIDI